MTLLLRTSVESNFFPCVLCICAYALKARKDRAILCWLHSAISLWRCHKIWGIWWEGFGEYFIVELWIINGHLKLLYSWLRNVSNEALEEDNISGIWKLTVLTSTLQVAPMVFLFLLPNNAAEQAIYIVSYSCLLLILVIYLNTILGGTREKQRALSIRRSYIFDCAVYELILHYLHSNLEAQ
jgi:hypothetical protein